MTLSLFCDGGCIGRNPSRRGGTWAWRLVNGEEIVNQASGAVSPDDIGAPVATNNVTELLAVVRGLEANPDFRGDIYTDSLVTLRRMTTSLKFNGVPLWLRLRALGLRREAKLRREAGWKIFLLKGHPSGEDLKRGKTLKGALVSEHNVWCDLACGRAAEEFLRRK